MKFITRIEDTFSNWEMLIDFRVIECSHDTAMTDCHRDGTITIK